MFELRTAPAPLEFAELGSVVEIREIPAMRQVDLVAQNKADGGDMKALQWLYLAEALHVDGVPIGMDRLRSLPGRFTLPLIRAQATLSEVHAELAVAEAPESDADVPKD